MRTLAAALLVAIGAAAQTQPAVPKLPPGVYAVINTSMGTITAELYDQVAPNTVRNFIGLARGTRPWLDPKTKQMVTRPLYDNITFHRVIPDFMIQTGDPTGVGNHNCGFLIRDEIVPTLKFDRPGRLAMANTGTPNSGACQFFITDAATPMLNGIHTIFGQVVDGQPVVAKIARVIRDNNDKPRFPIKLINVNVIRIVTTQPTQASKTAPAFYINATGDLLTRYESVQGCSELRLRDGSKVSLALSDRQNGLALLRSGKKVDAFAAFAEVNGSPASEPLAGPGGVAIKAAVAMGFLEANQVSYTKTAGSAGVDAAQVAEKALQYTAEVQCWN